MDFTLPQNIRLIDAFALAWRYRATGFNGTKLRVLLMPGDPRVKYTAVLWWSQAGEHAPRGVVMLGQSYPVRNPRPGVHFIESKFEDYVIRSGGGVKFADFPRLRRFRKFVVSKWWRLLEVVRRHGSRVKARFF